MVPIIEKTKITVWRAVSLLATSRALLSSLMPAPFNVSSESTFNPRYCPSLTIETLTDILLQIVDLTADDGGNKQSHSYRHDGKDTSYSPQDRC